MRQHKGFDFGNFEITPREILASVTIIVVMLILGMVISNNIDNYLLDKNEEYNQAIKIKNNDVFQYGMETNIGNAFVYGKLEPVDTVTYEEIGGKYYYIKKIRQEYRRHTRIVKSGKHYVTRVYYTWDTMWSTSKICKKIKFAGKTFKEDKISFIEKHYIKTIKTMPHIRYKYYGMKAKPIKGTVYTKLKNNTIKSCKFNKTKLQDAVEQYKCSGGIGKFIFWFFWFVLTGFVTFGFYYIDNDWLE